jgi:hypothetical protein
MNLLTLDVAVKFYERKANKFSTLRLEELNVIAGWIDK